MKDKCNCVAFILQKELSKGPPVTLLTTIACAISDICALNLHLLQVCNMAWRAGRVTARGLAAATRPTSIAAHPSCETPRLAGCGAAAISHLSGDSAGDNVPNRLKRLSRLQNKMHSSSGREVNTEMEKS